MVSDEEKSFIALTPGFEPNPKVPAGLLEDRVEVRQLGQVDSGEEVVQRVVPEGGGHLRTQLVKLFSRSLILWCNLPGQGTLSEWEGSVQLPSSLR